MTDLDESQEDETRRTLKLNFGEGQLRSPLGEINGVILSMNIFYTALLLLFLFISSTKSSGDGVDCEFYNDNDDEESEDLCSGCLLHDECAWCWLPPEEEDGRKVFKGYCYALDSASNAGSVGSVGDPIPEEDDTTKADGCDDDKDKKRDGGKSLRSRDASGHNARTSPAERPYGGSSSGSCENDGGTEVLDNEAGECTPRFINIVAIIAFLIIVTCTLAVFFKVCYPRLVKKHSAATVVPGAPGDRDGDANMAPVSATATVVQPVIKVKAIAAQPGYGGDEAGRFGEEEGSMLGMGTSPAPFTPVAQTVSPEDYYRQR